MKITVVTGSPHKKGTSALLVEEFVKGAEESGHDVFVFNAAFEKVAPCLGCDYCLKGDGTCIHQDSMPSLIPKLLEAELIVFATPLYYFGMSAQIKAVIDRLYSINNKVTGGKKAILMVTAADTEKAVMHGLVEQYKIIVDFLEWKNKDILLALGCGTREDIEETDYPKKAYKIGKSLK